MEVRPLSDAARELIDIVLGEPRLDDIAECFLSVSRLMQPGLDPAPFLRRLRDYAARLEPAMDSAADDLTRVERINHFLFREERFRGNREDYYDPRNSLLHEVLDRRLGLPITLSVLYIDIGRRLGLGVEGVSFPGHFLVRFDTGLPGQFRIVDPFSGGRLLTASSLCRRLQELGDTPVPDPLKVLEPAPPAAIIRRGLRNLRGAYLRRRDLMRALLLCDVLLELNPVDPAEWLSRGRILEDMDCPGAACDDYRRTLALAPDADPEGRLERRMRRLGSRASRFH